MSGTVQPGFLARTWGAVKGAASEAGGFVKNNKMAATGVIGGSLLLGAFAHKTFAGSGQGDNLDIEV